MPRLRPSSPAARAFARSHCRVYLRPGSRIPHRPAGMLFVPPLFTIVNPIPANVSSQALTTQTLTVTTPCTMTAKLWGGGGGGFDPFNSGVPRGGGGGFATAVFSLQTGDVVTYAAGGAGGGYGSGSFRGTSGSGTRNGGRGLTAGGGATELYINGVAVLLAGGGGGAANRGGGGGGGTNGQDGHPNGGGGSPGGGGTQSGPGAGGNGSSGRNGQPGSGGTGGDGYYAGTSGDGGGGGGGYFGGGGGWSSSESITIPSPGGGGSGYDSTGSGTLIAATDWQAANNTDPDWTGNAGNAEVNGLVVLNFAA